MPHSPVEGIAHGGTYPASVLASVALCCPIYVNVRFHLLMTSSQAFGITMWEIFTYGGRPYGEMSNHIIGYEVQKGTRPFHPSGCSEDVYGLMLRCWSETPEDRPAFGEIVDKIRDMETAARAAAGGMNPRCIGELSVSRTPDAAESSPYRTLPNGTVMEYAGFGGNNDTLLKKSGHLTYSGLGGGGGGIAQEYAGFAGTGHTYAAPKDSDGHATYRGEEIYGRQADCEDIYAGADAVNIPVRKRNLLTRGPLMGCTRPHQCLPQGRTLLNIYMEFMLTCAIPMTHNNEGQAPRSGRRRGVVSRLLHARHGGTCDLLARRRARRHVPG